LKGLDLQEVQEADKARDVPVREMHIKRFGSTKMKKGEE
jgi:hypothetical protein